MHHAGAHNFNPVLIAVDGAAPGVGVNEVGDGHIHARLYEREVIAAEANLPAGAEHPAGEFVEGAFQIGESDALGHGQPFNLIEVPFVSGVGSFVAVAFAGNDDAYRRLLGFHNAGLHWRGVSAQQHWLLSRLVDIVHPQGVPQIPGRVAGGYVQHLKVIVVQLHFGAFHYAEAHRRERAANFAHNLSGGMQASGDDGTPGQGNIQGVAGGQPGLGDFAGATGQGFLQDGFGPVGAGTELPPPLGFQLGNGAKQPGEPPAPAQICYAPLLGGVSVADALQFVASSAGQFIEVGVRQRRRHGRGLARHNR